MEMVESGKAPWMSKMLTQGFEAYIWCSYVYSIIEKLYISTEQERRAISRRKRNEQ
jgi:hypothetical protein